MLSSDKYIVTLLGFGAVAFLYWFFFGEKEPAVKVDKKITITVDGGYSPAIVSIPLGQETELIFVRKDPSACLEEVIISDFGIRKHLPLNDTVSVKITPTRSGEFPYSCGMSMFHGKIIVT